MSRLETTLFAYVMGLHVRVAKDKRFPEKVRCHQIEKVSAKRNRKVRHWQKPNLKSLQGSIKGHLFLLPGARAHIFHIFHYRVASGFVN